MLPTTLSNRLQQMVDAIQNYKQDIAVVFGDEALEIFNMMQALAAEAKIAVDAKPLPQIIIVKTDEWEGLWVDGKLVEEDESIRIETLTEHIPSLKITEVWDESKALKKQMQDTGFFPENYIPEPLR